MCIVDNFFRRLLSGIPEFNLFLELILGLYIFDLSSNEFNESYWRRGSLRPKQDNNSRRLAKLISRREILTYLEDMSETEVVFLEMKFQGIQTH